MPTVRGKLLFVQNVTLFPWLISKARHYTERVKFSVYFWKLLFGVWNKKWNGIAHNQHVVRWKTKWKMCKFNNTNFLFTKCIIIIIILFPILMIIKIVDICTFWRLIIREANNNRWQRGCWINTGGKHKRRNICCIQSFENEMSNYHKLFVQQ